MRYLNWDVLLFPEDSKIPIQEFDVKCYALPVQSDDLRQGHLVAAAAANSQVCVTQVPILTGFIPSLDSGRKFRVSIHSWERPQSSNLVRLVQPPESKVAFEVRLYIDGKMKVQRDMDQYNPWPEVIGASGCLLLSIAYEYPDQLPRKSHNPLPLALEFPPFRPELLQQSHWDAGDDLGRIKIVIAEGFRELNRPSFKYGIFEKVRDVVIFSFQHAPQRTLEQSGIAWPNARLLRTIPTSPYPQTDMDAHAHSPQRSEKSIMGRIGSKASPTEHATALQGSKWAGKLHVIPDDPFVAPTHSSRSQRKTSGDVSMADYMTNVKRGKNPSEMSGVAIQQLDFPQQMQRAAAEEILQELSPAKRRALVDLIMLSNPSSTKLSTTQIDKESSVIETAQKLQAERSSSVTRRSSTGSRRSVSGQSATMS